MLRVDVANRGGQLMHSGIVLPMAATELLRLMVSFTIIPLLLEQVFILFVGDPHNCHPLNDTDGRQPSVTPHHQDEHLLQQQRTVMYETMSLHDKSKCWERACGLHQ